LTSSPLNPIFSTEGVLVAKIRVGELGGQSYSLINILLPCKVMTASTLLTKKAKNMEVRAEDYKEETHRFI
jgi:hypothetical protein